jgi:hypothetical protein
MLGVFAFTLFCSASLLFLVEPMVGKMMLPLLGGTPAVWNTCMVFFQAVLLAGYAYAHAATSWLGPRKQAAAHLAVLVVPLLFFLVNGPLAVNPAWVAGGEAAPVLSLLLALTVSVGVPLFVVCTSAPLLQRWFSSTDHPDAADPYFLYGASNLGSMLALVGYPAVVEPYLTLESQRVGWAVGYGLLAALTAACAYLMWKSRPAAALQTAAAAAALVGEPEPAVARPAAFQTAGKGVRRGRGKPPARPKQPPREIPPSPGPTGPAEPAPRADRPVTWGRRLRWTLLAAVPSSLMLGATTYITTDIAAIPLLWVLPLALYLLSFIIVFAKISPRTQAVLTLVALDALLLALVEWVAPVVFDHKPPLFEDDNLLWLVRLAGLVLLGLSFQLLKVRDAALTHHAAVLVMPLLVLLLVFLVTSELKLPSVTLGIGVHLLTLFVISMVCHGELARDRPAARHLTEFFLLMSAGGVVGGLFNALLAPLLFNSVVEYQLVLAASCLLLPPLGPAKESRWALRADVALAGIFAGVGGLLLVLFWVDGSTDLSPLAGGPLRWAGAALLLGVAVGGLAAWQGWGAPPGEGGKPPANDAAERLLDVVLPLALMVLAAGLDWGLSARNVTRRLVGLAFLTEIDPKQLAVIVRCGLPAVLCYTFVERSVRFGLGVGGILLAAALCSLVYRPPVLQTRGFFGVLLVEKGERGADGYRFATRALYHGTTLHGEQLDGAAFHDIPLSYYHRTGPAGRVFRACNTDPKRPVAVIGLGTGTMATYALPGQRLDFFDIDAKVVGVSYDTDEYFTFVADAAARGVELGLVLGDARLTFDTKGERPRLPPLRRRTGAPAPSQAAPGAGAGAAPGAGVRGPLAADQRYGLIVVDAFSSDAIPVHLITRQAVQIYRDRLQDGGLLCLHISNRHLQLQPVLANIAAELGMAGCHMNDKEGADADPPRQQPWTAPGKGTSEWVVLANKPEDLQKLLGVPRWQNADGPLALVGAGLWPVPGATGGGTAGGLCLALAGALQGEPAMKPVTAWAPLETLDQLGVQLEAAEAALKAAGEQARARPSDDAVNDVRLYRNERDAVLKKIARTRRVGVWTDDYSNLLSVFRW